MSSTVTAHTRAEWRRLLALAWPIVAVNVGTQLMAVVDTALSGRVTSLAQAGTGLGATVFFFGALLGMGVIMGLDPLTSQSIGAGRRDQAHTQVWQGAWLALALAVPLMGLTFAAARGLESIGIAPDLAAEARRYLDARLPSMLPLLVMTAMRSYLQAVHRVMPLLATTIAANIVNIVADWILVFGDDGLAGFGIAPLGIPALGVTGLGLATTLATTLHMAMLGFAVSREGATTPAHRAPQASTIRAIAALGFPIAIHMAAEIGIFTLAGILAGRIGALEMAAHQVALQLAALTFMVPMGVAQAGSVRVGNAIGARDTDRMRKAATAAVAIGAGFMSVAALTMWTVPAVYARLMSGDAAVVALATRLIIIAGAFQLFDGIQVVSAGVLRGAGLTRWTMAANLVAYWIVACPLVFAFAANSTLGVRGIWIGLTAGLFAAAVMLVGKVVTVVRRADVSSLAVIPT